MRVGVTGHQRLPGRGVWPWVRTSIATILPLDHVVGLSSLAVGTDQLFAEVVLEHRGSLTAVIPFPDYESRFHERRQRFVSLLHRATEIVRLEGTASDEESYYEAGRWIVDHCDWMVAVWNGLPARGRGGTADIVAYAKRMQRPLVHINPVNRVIQGAEQSADPS